MRKGKKLTYTTIESISKRNNYVIKQKKKIINNKSIEEYKSLLSQHNAKSCNFDIFYDYIKKWKLKR